MLLEWGGGEDPPKPPLLTQGANYAPRRGGAGSPQTPPLDSGGQLHPEKGGRIPPNPPHDSGGQLQPKKGHFTQKNPKKFKFPAIFALKCGPIRLIPEINVPDIDPDHHRKFRRDRARELGLVRPVTDRQTTTTTTPRQTPPLVGASPLRQNPCAAKFESRFSLPHSPRCARGMIMNMSLDFPQILPKLEYNSHFFPEFL